MSKCNDGSSVLIILKARISDSGAYSCEAINNQGREIYPYDAIVTVKRCSNLTTTPTGATTTTSATTKTSVSTSSTEF
jgi:hypothetical protein